LFILRGDRRARGESAARFLPASLTATVAADQKQSILAVANDGFEVLNFYMLKGAAYFHN
jgi:hypothetical protein